MIEKIGSFDANFNKKSTETIKFHKEKVNMQDEVLASNFEKLGLFLPVESKPKPEETPTIIDAEKI